MYNIICILFHSIGSGDDGEEDDDDDENEFGSDGGSVSLDGEDYDDEDGSDIFEASDDEENDDEEDDEDEDDAPKHKKAKRSLSDKDFERKLKRTDGIYLRRFIPILCL